MLLQSETKRYNDQISDYSVKAFNEGLEREQAFPAAPGGDRPDRLFAPGKSSAEIFCCASSPKIQEAAEFKEWEMPVNQMGGIHTTYPQLVEQLEFKTVKDYDDWIARLHAISKAFEQVQHNMSVGVDDHRVPPRYLLSKAVDQIKTAGKSEAGRIPSVHASKDHPRLDTGCRAGAYQERDADCHWQGSVAGLSSV